MIFSLSVLLYFMVLSILFQGREDCRNKFITLFVCLLSISLLNCLRIYCQYYFPDIENYDEIFSNVLPFNLELLSVDGISYSKADVDLGFILIVSIFKLFSDDFQLFLLTLFVYQITVFYFFCKSQNINVFLAAPVYIALTFFTFQIGILRQAIAFTFFLIAINLINKKYYYIFFIGVGALFHKSILICLFLGWANKRVDIKIYLLLFVLGLLVYFMRIDIMQYNFAFLEQYDLFDRVLYYSNVDRPDNFLGIGFFERVIFFTLMFSIYIQLSSQDKITQSNILIFNLGMAVILAQIYFWGSPTITSRFRYYLVIFPYIYISIFLLENTKSWFRYSGLIFFDLILAYYMVYQSDYLEQI